MGIENIIQRACVQTAVYWGDPADDGYGGKTFGNGYPVEIDCRWEDTVQVVRDARGNEIICRALVFVTEDLDEQGYLYLGSLDDLDSSEEGDPMTVDGAYSIKRFDETPALYSTTEFVRKAYL